MKTCFILGAGVSASAGLPLASGLLTEVAERGLDRSDVDELHEILGYLLPTFKSADANYPDIEEFLTILDVAESYALMGTPHPEFPRRRLLRARRIVMDGLIWVLSAGHEKVVGGHPICVLVQALRPGDTVITFNYDLTIEAACKDKNVAWSYEPNDDVVTLLKPHGSINWYALHELDFVPEHKLDLMTELERYDLLLGNREQVAGISPVIVPPIANKLIEYPDLRTIWSWISSAVTHADSVYVLGYSLPEADRLTRFVLRQSITSRAGGGAGVWVVNPDGKMRSRYAECISPHVEFVQQRFEKWVTSFAALQGITNSEDALPTSIEQLMLAMPRAFKPENAEGASAKLLFTFTGDEPGSWVLTVDKGQCTIRRGTITAPDIRINSPSEVWLKIVRRELDGATAFMNRQFSFTGDTATLMQMQNWFGQDEAG